MIKLVPAKCPCCGANLELDDNLKKTECKYCKTTIIVDEAIEKYQIEVAGKIKISGIQDDDDKLEIAKNYIIIKNYAKAKETLEDILEKNPFNINAVKMIMEVNILLIENTLKKEINEINLSDMKLFDLFFDYKKQQEYLEIIKSMCNTEFTEFINKMMLLHSKIDKLYEEYSIEKEKEKKNVERKKQELAEEEIQINLLIKKCNAYLSKRDKYIERLKQLLELFSTSEKHCTDATIATKGLLYSTNRLDYFPTDVVAIGEDYIEIKQSSNSLRNLRFNCTKNISIEDKLKLLEELEKKSQPLFSKIFKK